MKIHIVVFILLTVLVGLVISQTSAQDESQLDEELRARLSMMGIAPLRPLPPPDPALVALGEALFYDNILSGNRDIACATCHHPSLNTTDQVSLGLGTGTNGLGPLRVHVPDRPFIPRNAPDLFNRGATEWFTMFWDGRVMQASNGTLITPADDLLPHGLNNALAAQAMFPVTSGAEMRGLPGDTDIFGSENELLLVADDDLTALWGALVTRLLSIPGYVTLFEAAYSDIPVDSLGFQHAANAIAAYEAYAFMFVDSPWNQYLAGDNEALSTDAKHGALLFFGDAGCSQCHGGNLLTDQSYHNMAVPQLGPGRGPDAPLDYGRERVTNSSADRFAFRTPSLLNVALTGPYMHNGAYVSLMDAVLHMIDPIEGLLTYDAGQLSSELRETWQDDLDTRAAVLATHDPMAGSIRPLTSEEIATLIAFLEALTDPRASNLSRLVPDDVPSGLPVSDEEIH